jgi:dUTP pyrophosphatase
LPPVSSSDPIRAAVPRSSGGSSAGVEPPGRPPTPAGPPPRVDGSGAADSRPAEQAVAQPAERQRDGAPGGRVARTAAGTAAGNGTTVEVLVRRLDPDVPLPSYALPDDAGADIVTTVAATLAPGERAVLPTGLALALPSGYAAFVHPRSGLAARCGMALVNAPGTVDAGYRGEVKVIVINHDPVRPLQLARGDRIAQLVIQRVEQAAFRLVETLPESTRGGGGHGSTGGHARLVADSGPAGEGER